MLWSYKVNPPVLRIKLDAASTATVGPESRWPNSVCVCVCACTGGLFKTFFHESATHQAGLLLTEFKLGETVCQHSLSLGYLGSSINTR